MRGKEKKVIHMLHTHPPQNICSPTKSSDNLNGLPHSSRNKTRYHEHHQRCMHSVNRSRDSKTRHIVKEIWYKSEPVKKH